MRCSSSTVDLLVFDALPDPFNEDVVAPTWALCENQSRSHSAAVREGRRLVFDTVADALTSKAWFGAESASTAVGKLLPKS